MISLSLNKNKQSGFTLIELMVVMAIIAILATAGLSAYTGYIKKARDATRIADINAINKIVLANMSVAGMPPQTALAVYTAVVAANNGTMLYDPIAPTGTQGVLACMTYNGLPTKECYYTYRICDGGMGYAVGTRFESVSNVPLYLTDNIPSAASPHNITWHDNGIYELGSCMASCAPTIAGCYSANWYQNISTKIKSSSPVLLDQGF